jgi:hypothetical protein
MLPSFVTTKLSRGSKLRAEVMLIYTDQGWKARAFYYADPKSQTVIASGEEVLNEEQALVKVREVANEWRKEQTRKGKY